MEKLVPKLRFPEFEGDKSIYRKYNFEDIFLFSTGKNIKFNEASIDYEIPCVRYGELYHMYSEVIYEIVNKTNLDKSELLFSEGNEILLPSAGEDPLDIGSASALTVKNVAIGRTINILKPKDQDIYSPIYVSYYINKKLKKKIASLAKGVSISNVYNSDLKTLKIKLPSLKEQQKIATFLTSVNERITLLEKQKQGLETYKKGVMQQIFSQQLRFKPDPVVSSASTTDSRTVSEALEDTESKTTEETQSFPDWEEKKLGDIIKEQVFKSTINNQYVILSSTKDDVFIQSEFFTRDIASKNNIGYKILKRNQLVLSPQNIWMGNINLNKKYEIGIVSPSYKIFDFKKNFSPDFFSYFFKQPKLIFEYGQCSEQGASIVRRNLNLEFFLTIRIKVPIYSEQQKIATFLSAIDERITVVNKQIEQSKIFKKGLLQQMFV